MVRQAALPKSYWALAMAVAVHVRSRVLSGGAGGVPFTLATGRRADLSSMRIFACTAYVHENTDFRTINRGALFTDGGTITNTPQILWAHTLDLRPVFCGPKFVHVHAMHASMRGSEHVFRGKPVDYSSPGSQHVCTIGEVSAECEAPSRLHSGDSENGMPCALE
jgi:hypothetical protein